MLKAISYKDMWANQRAIERQTEATVVLARKLAQAVADAERQGVSRTVILGMLSHQQVMVSFDTIQEN